MWWKSYMKSFPWLSISPFIDPRLLCWDWCMTYCSFWPFGWKICPFNMKIILLFVPFLIKREKKATSLLFQTFMAYDSSIICFGGDIAYTWSIIQANLIKKYHDIFKLLVWYCHDNHDILSLTFAENHAPGAGVQRPKLWSRVEKSKYT